MRKNVYWTSLRFIFSIAFLGLLSCSDTEKEVLVPLENPEVLNLDRDEVSLLQGKSITLNIESGNGGYTVSSSNKEVATASVADNKITITATTKEDRAETVIIVTDKRYQRTLIDVKVAKLFDLTVDKKTVELELGNESLESISIKILSGNTKYNTEYVGNANQFIEVDTTGIKEFATFKVKALGLGNASINVTDSLGQSTQIDFEVVTPKIVAVDKTELSFTKLQEVNTLNIEDNAAKSYNVIFDNPLLAKAVVDGKKVAITSKLSGKTTFVVEADNGRRSQPVTVNITAPEYAFNFGEHYYGYTDYRSIAAVDMSVTSLKQVTFEMTCKMNGYRGLQTFMGLEGRLIIRGENDDYKESHPIRIAGLGDKVMLLSSKSFNLNEWMHIALVVDCSKNSTKEKYKLYINGVQDELIVDKEEETHSSVDLTDTSDDGKFVVAQATGQSWRAMQGTVSFARVWRVARTEKQIQDNMCSLEEANPQGLLSNWDFSNGKGMSFIEDVNGVNAKANLTIAEINKNGDSKNYNPTEAPADRFVNKGCPN